MYLDADPGSFYPYIATVRITDAAGRTNEALLAFAATGPVKAGPTINTYAKQFREATPDTPPGWEIHHTLQVGRDDATGTRILERRYLRERGINIHEAKYLRAVRPEIHAEITRAQNAWWKEQMKNLGVSSRADAMLVIKLADYDAFVAKLDAQYRIWWIGPGRNQMQNVVTIVNRFNQSGGRWSWVAGKGTRWKNLGFTALAGVGIFSLFSENAKAAVNIAYHDDTALAKWDAFASAYDAAMTEVIDPDGPGRLKHNTAIQLRDAMIAYARAIKLDESVLTKIQIALGAYCDIKLDP